jgi:hypothetical protein
MGAGVQRRGHRLLLRAAAAGSSLTVAAGKVGLVVKAVALGLGSWSYRRGVSDVMDHVSALIFPLVGSITASPTNVPGTNWQCNPKCGHAAIACCGH